MGYNSHQKFQDNIEAVRIALEWKEGITLSEKQLDCLERYAGFGGLKAILFPATNIEEWKKLNASVEDLKLYPQVMEMHRLLHQHFNGSQYRDIIDSLKNSILTAFYTPSFVPETLFDVLKENRIEPLSIYDPSSGAGIFIMEAAKRFPGLKNITAFEKDMLSGRVLNAVSSSIGIPVSVQVKGFENSDDGENGKSDIITSNIPFGNFKVYDPSYSDQVISGKIHNYFFAKGLDKIKDGGLLAYLTTDAFLNSPSNEVVRKYVFQRADFISLNVMPDNLMKDIGNTEAPSHLLIIQKNLHKEKLSHNEELLLETVKCKNEFGEYAVNLYIFNHPEIILGDQIKPGQNQYGQAHESVWQKGEMVDIKKVLANVISKGFRERFNKEAFSLTIVKERSNESKKLTCLPMPESRPDYSSVQLGLFDVVPAIQANRAMCYIKDSDESVVEKKSARIVNIVSSKDHPDHEYFVFLAARSKSLNQYIYKLCSNVKEINFQSEWVKAIELQNEIKSLSDQLLQYDQVFYNKGDVPFHISTHKKDNEDEIVNPNPLHREGTLVVYGESVGSLSFVLDEDRRRCVFIPDINNKKDFDFYKQYTEVRDCYLLFTNGDKWEDSKYLELRNQLNESYEALVKGYGILNSAVNRRRVLKDEAFGFVMLASLERKVEDQFVKADVLTQSLAPMQEAFHANNPLEALARSLNDKGIVDIEFIAAATGSTEVETIHELGDHIYLNPGKGTWETADEFLSGNVIAKLNIAKEKGKNNTGDPQFQRSLDALEKIQPEKIPFELLDFNLGERWIPGEYYNRFAGDLFELEVEVSYFPSADTFKVKVQGSNAKTNQEYAVTTRSGRTTYCHTLMEHALENTTPFYTYEVDSGETKIRVPDNEAIQLAHQKIESIRNGFNHWLKDLPETDRNDLEKLYNNTFNCYVLRKYDGTHLQFPGLDKKRLGIEDLYSSQKDSVWRIIQNRGALIDHEVGLGKTLTMVVASHEMKRLGIIQKPMILALKSNVNQITETYRKAYPNAKILFPGENDFTPVKRLRLFHEIKNNHWDCIILTHDQFGKIPQSREIQREIFQTELDNVEKDLYTLKEMGNEISRRMLKGLEIRKNNLGIHLQKVYSDIEGKKDAGINFKDLGIDHLFVDESHKFKNLTFTTRHDRVGGLGNMEGSQKALNMLFAVRTLQEKFGSDLCVTFLSGTPISNSLTEMYLLFKYLRPNEMRRQQVENFDAWASVFARKTVDFEFSVTNEIMAKERFRHFIKVPELALFYNEITDYKTARHIHLDKPGLEEELIHIPPTPEQEQFIRNLVEFAKTGNGELIGRRPLTKEEDKGRMLIATNYAKKMATDMRLINPFVYSDHPSNKVNICARKVAELYRVSNDQKGTQLVFCDIGTPKPNAFNIYDALKEKLVTDFNIPLEHITFIHDWMDRQKPELFRKMNHGDIRILLGSTEKAGTGLNVQRNVIAIHHLDIPWKPSELEQRNGRGARQGNILAKEAFGNKVKNYIYAVEQSLDNYKFNLLKNKQTFISQMKNCELNVRSIDEGAIDEKSGMNFSEYIAILSGDTSLLEKSKMEKKIAVLESLKGAHYKEMIRSRFQLEKLERDKDSTIQTISKLSSDEREYKKFLQFEKDGSKSNPVKIDSIKSEDAEEIGRHLILLSEAWKPPSEDSDIEKIGNLYGFKLFIRRQREAYDTKGMFEYKYRNVFYAESKGSGIKYLWNQGYLNIDNAKLAARYFLNAIDRVGVLHEKYLKDLQDISQDIPMLQQIVKKPFDRDDDLERLKNGVMRLEREITLRIQENQMNQHDKEKEESELKIAPIIKMDTRKSLNSLMPQNKIVVKREKSINL